MNTNKNILALRRDVFKTQQHIEKIYSIVSALYQEIQEIKKETNIGPTKQTYVNNNPNEKESMGVLDDLTEYADNLPRNSRKVKIINN